MASLLALPDELLLHVYLALADDPPAAGALLTSCRRLYRLAHDPIAFKRFAERQPPLTLRAACRALLNRPELQPRHLAKVQIMADLLPTAELPYVVRLLVRSGHLDLAGGAPDAVKASPHLAKVARAARRTDSTDSAYFSDGDDDGDDGGREARRPRAPFNAPTRALLEMLRRRAEPHRAALVNEALQDAAACGSRAAVNALLDGLGTATPAIDLTSALVAASSHGQTAVMRLLLHRGAEPSSAALVAAAENGHAAAVRVLLEHGAYVGAANEAALRLAATEGHDGAVRVLVNAGANVHAMSDAPLREAARNGHVNVLIVLVQAGAQPSARAWEALRWAALGGHLAAVQFLLECGPTFAAVEEAIRASASIGYHAVARALVAYVRAVPEWSANLQAPAALSPRRHRFATLGSGRAGTASAGDFGWAAESSAPSTPTTPSPESGAGAAEFAPGMDFGW